MVNSPLIFLSGQQRSHKMKFEKMQTCYCLLTSTGARYIGELLQVNTRLEVLWMGNNNLGDDGITVIAEALSNSRIRKLTVYKCGITVSGAKELATSLAINQSVVVLSVWENSITVEGARLLLQSAVNNGVCEEVSINDEYKEDNEIQQMLNVLETRQKVGINNNNMV